MLAEGGTICHLKYLVCDEWELGIDSQAALRESLHVLLPPNDNIQAGPHLHLDEPATQRREE
jgi:hypothetical protein